MIFTILERSLILDKESLQLVGKELQEHFPSATAPRAAQRQIKLAFLNLQCRRLKKVFEDLGKLLWESTSTKQKSETWVMSFCLVLLLALVADKTFTSAHHHCEGRIKHAGHDPKMERAHFQRVIDIMEKELLGRCKEIFHWKFKTRSKSKEACNPIRDGVAAFGKSTVPEPRIVELVTDLQYLVQDFGTYSFIELKYRPSTLTIPEPQIRYHSSRIQRDKDSMESMYADAGRSTCIFLDDFLGR